MEEEYVRTRKIEHVTKVFFFLNTTKVGNYAFWAANYLKAVDIPEGEWLSHYSLRSPKL